MYIVHGTYDVHVVGGWGAVTATLDLQRTQPDRRAGHRAGCPGAGDPPDPPPETAHHQRRRTPCSASAPAARDNAELLTRAARRDPAAWEEIVRRYSGLVWARVRSLRLQDADAVDAVQMTWLRLAENCDRIEHPDRLGGWLTTTAYRECLRILRPTRQTAEPVDGLADTLPDPAAGPEQTVLDTETAALLRGLVAELPPRSRTLIQAMF